MDKISELIETIQKKFNIIGRQDELEKIIIAHSVGKHILIEGEVGVGKTTLARAVADYFDKDFFRIDCSEDTLTHNLVGYWNPPMVIADGYIEDSYLYGPLAEAMMNGGCLFINEINRMPESTQNALLTSLDERILKIPKLKTIEASDGFFVIATQNPAAHVGVSVLGEALKDRFIWVKLEYQPPEEERAIIKQEVGLNGKDGDRIAIISQKVIQETRERPSLRRGSSIRGGIDLAALVNNYGEQGLDSSKVWVNSAIMALFNKIELEDGITRTKNDIITNIVLQVLNQTDFQ
ncbi:MAG: MoxR family ATPase [Promethearchaeia archaeon]